jgi:Domain of unknown function (DUF4062)
MLVTGANSNFAGIETSIRSIVITRLGETRDWLLKVSQRDLEIPGQGVGMTEAATAPEGTSAIERFNPLFRKWKVFVSSTSFGLDGFRQVAREVIEGFKFDGRAFFEPVMMEDFGARDGTAREVCAEYVRGCDVLVGIIGIRYGAHPPEDQTSYTELEFQTAVDCQLSRLMFLLDEKVARRLEGAAPQGEDRADRQVKLRERIGTDRVSELTVRTEKDFRDKLTRALDNWVREDSLRLR